MAAKVKPVVEGQRQRLHALQIDNAFEHLLRLAEQGATPKTAGKPASGGSVRSRGRPPVPLASLHSSDACGRAAAVTPLPSHAEAAVPGQQGPNEERLLRVWGALQDTLRPLVGGHVGGFLDTSRAHSNTAVNAGSKNTAVNAAAGPDACSPATGATSDGSLSFGTALAAATRAGEEDAPWRIATTLWQWQQASKGGQGRTPQSAGSVGSVKQVCSWQGDVYTIEQRMH